MWRAAFIAGLSCLFLIDASLAEDVCISIPNGIMCGPTVENPGIVIRATPVSPPSQFPNSDERAAKPSGPRSADQYEEKGNSPRDELREGRRGERNEEPPFDYRSRRGDEPRFERGLRREGLDERRYNPRDRERGFGRERSLEDGDKYRRHTQNSDERRFGNRRYLEPRDERRGEPQFRGRYREYERNFERQGPRRQGRYYDPERD